MGNTVVWKPASTASLSAHYVMRLLQAAGLPDGVINLVHGSGATIGAAALASPELAGIHFTGSTDVFNGMWKTVGKNVGSYRNYPRIVGETGGKDFILAHPSADAEAVATAVVRGSFEYQGQKCSAASRLYVPSNLWPEVKERLVEDVATIKMGDVSDFENFMGAVIDSSAFKTHAKAIEEARSAGAEIVAGGSTDDSEGYFVSPTVIATDDKGFRLLRDELFGPIVTTYVYDEKRWGDTLELVDETAPYGLTGAVFATERAAIDEAQDALRYAAGNFYVNDKPTGAVVGQQPFGGSRASGTNDKAGSMWNLIRWVSPRTIKETFVSADRLPLPVPRVRRRPHQQLADARSGSDPRRDRRLPRPAGGDRPAARVHRRSSASWRKLFSTSQAWRNILVAAYPDREVPRRSISPRTSPASGSTRSSRSAQATRCAWFSRTARSRTRATRRSSRARSSSRSSTSPPPRRSSSGPRSRWTSCRASASFPDLRSFDFAWLLDRPLAAELILAAILIALVDPRHLDPRPRRRLLGSRQAGVRGRARPSGLLRLGRRSGRPRTGASGSSRSGSCSTPSTSRSRSRTCSSCRCRRASRRFSRSPRAGSAPSRRSCSTCSAARCRARSSSRSASECG